MPADHAPTAESLSEGQRRVIDHGEGALLLTGVAGSGRTEALARRLARLAPSGEGVLVLTYSHAAASDLRLRAEEAIEDPFEELAVHPYREAAVRLLREHAVEAGVDPFLERLDSAERLAMLLDRADELPLRRHQIRGNRAGLLARLVERIDALKAAAVTSERFHEWAEQRLGDAADAAERDTAEREAEFARLYEIHDSIIREAGGIDGGEAVLTLSRLLGERPALAAEVARRFPNLIVDELEDACAAELTMLEALARGSRSFVASCDPDQARSREASGGRGLDAEGAGRERGGSRWTAPGATAGASWTRPMP